MEGSRLLLTIGVGGAIMVVLEFSRVTLMRILLHGLSSESTEKPQVLPQLMLNFAFVVLLPAIVYAALYPILPFTSYRSGLFIALFIFGVGLLPAQVRLYYQHKIPAAISAFDLFWNLLTLLIIMGCITYLYHY